MRYPASTIAFRHRFIFMSILCLRGRPQSKSREIRVSLALQILLRRGAMCLASPSDKKTQSRPASAPPGKAAAYPESPSPALNPPTHRRRLHVAIILRSHLFVIRKSGLIDVQTAPAFLRALVRSPAIKKINSRLCLVIQFLRIASAIAGTRVIALQFQLQRAKILNMLVRSKNVCRLRSRLCGRW